MEEKAKSAETSSAADKAALDDAVKESKERLERMEQRLKEAQDAKADADVEVKEVC